MPKPPGSFLISAFAAFALFIVTASVVTVSGQSVRDRTRSKPGTVTPVTESQATTLTLTLTETALRPVQTWIRTAAAIDGSRKTLTARLSSSDASLVKPGQRVRAFPPNARSSVYQAKVTRVSGQLVEATLQSTGRENSLHYVMEIVVDRGQFLSVPNEAIIEEGGKQVVYFQQHPGHYVPQEIHTGIQGELYTQVLHGLNAGDQVVTIGSFFIDADHKLKSTGSAPMSNGHQHH